MVHITFHFADGTSRKEGHWASKETFDLIYQYTLAMKPGDRISVEIERPA